MTEPAATPRRPSMLLTLLAVAAAAFVIGRVGGPLGAVPAALGTAAHEAGHALFADVLTGDVVSMTVFTDGGGVTVSTASDSRWRTFLVAGAGYPMTLFAGLGLLTAALFARSTRLVAAGLAVVAAVSWVLWTPFNSRVPGLVDDADQRFTWFVLGVTVLVGVAVAVLPERWETARRIALGVLAAGLLTDALGAGRDLVLIEDRAGATTTDADTLAESVGALSSSTWAWLMRASLFAIGVAWALLVLRHAAPEEGAASPPSPGG